MSGVFGQTFGRKYSRPGPCVQLGEVVGQLLLGVAPGEVGVRLAEADLGQPVHHARPREGLGQEDHVRVGGRTLRDRPFPEREGLGVRVVDAEDAHALLAPELEDAGQRLPHRAPVAASRSRTGRCPGTSSAGSRRTGCCRRRASGTTRGCSFTHGWSGAHWNAMSSAISMPCSAARCDAAARKSSSVPSSPAGSRCGRLRRRRSPTGCRRRRRRGVERVVAALAAFAPDRVDRREVEHVEAHALRRRAARPRSRRSVPCRAGSSLAERGKNSYQLEKRARSRSTVDAVDLRVRAARGAGRDGAARARRAPRRAPTAFSVCGIGVGCRGGAAQFCAQLRSSAPSRRRRGALRGLLDQRGAGARGDAQVVDVDAAREVVPPRQEGVDPGAHRVLPAAERVDDERGAPAVVAERRHRPRCASSVSPARRHSSAPATTSWPSAKQSASTATVSPTMRLIGKRPPSTAA